MVADCRWPCGAERCVGLLSDGVGLVFHPDISSHIKHESIIVFDVRFLAVLMLRNEAARDAYLSGSCQNSAKLVDPARYVARCVNAIDAERLCVEPMDWRLSERASALIA